jgi:hypothetical protein
MNAVETSETISFYILPNSSAYSPITASLCAMNMYKQSVLLSASYNKPFYTLHKSQLLFNVASFFVCLFISMQCRRSNSQSLTDGVHSQTDIDSSFDNAYFHKLYTTYKSKFDTYQCCFMFALTEYSDARQDVETELFVEFQKAITWVT